MTLKIFNFITQNKENNFMREHELTKDDLCYWDNISKTLKGSQKSKAKAFNREKCIKYIGNGAFLCSPIKDYNSTFYTMKKEHGEFKCNCQWNVKNNLMCSHIMALYLYFANKTGSAE